MRKRIWHKRAAIALSIIVLIALFPWVIGIFFEKKYRSTIDLCNKEGIVAIKIVAYHRGYLHSYAKLNVQVIDPDYQIMAKTFNLDFSQLNFSVDQIITHGPIVATYYRGFNLRVALGDIRNVAKLTATQQPILVDEDIITLTGNYYKYFHIMSFDFLSADNLHFQFINGLSGTFRFYPREKRVSGNLDLLNFKLNDGDIFVSIPNVTIRYNQYKSPNDLWVGGLSILIAEIDGHNNDGGTFAINGIDFDADTTETKGKISDVRRLDVDVMDFSHQTLGPLHLMLSVDGLSAGAIKDMIAAYRKISLEGERYESQLSYKLGMMLPRVFTQDSAIYVQSFDLRTPIGGLTIQGKMDWPPSNISSPSTMGELMDISHVKGEVRVSRALSDKLISLAAELPYFRSITPEARRLLLNMQADAEMASQQNFLMISYFVDQGLVTEEAANQLINLQRNDVPLDVYSNELKDLLLKKEVMLAASYLLRLKYATVLFNENALDQAALVTQQSFAMQLREQFANWIKLGYVRLDKDDYVISLDKKNETILLNGKTFE